MSNKNKDTDDITQIWTEFERGKDYIDKLRLVSEINEAHRFYEGDQWHGLKSGGDKLPIIDVISPIVDYKVAIVTQNLMEIVYSPANYDDPQFQFTGDQICKMLNDHAAKLWESQKMDDVSFDAVEDAAISRAAYLHFYQTPPKTEKRNGEEIIVDPGKMEYDALDSAGIMFADEQERDIEKQPYILLPMRRRVADVRREAKENGIPAGDIENIVSDDDKDLQTGDRAQTEIDTDSEKNNGKCLCILKYWKENGKVMMSKATKNVVYKKPASTDLKGYPIAGMVWSRVKGTCRGQGVVNKLVPNQIEINRSMARRSINAKMTAFAKPIVDTSVVRNPDSVTEFGTRIDIEGYGLNSVLNAVGYLQPANIGPDAKAVQDELIQHTKENAGASDVARGSTELDTYRAVLAIQEAAAAPLNKQTIRYKRFIEDIARIWFDFWCNYYPNGLPVVVKKTVPITDSQGNTQEVELEVQEIIPADRLRKLKPSIRVDVTPTSPYNKFVEQQKADNLLTSEKIDFNEYVEIQPDSEPMKGKLERVIEARQQMQQIQEMMEAMKQYILEGRTREELLNEEVGQQKIALENAGYTLGRAAQLNEDTKKNYYKQGQMDTLAKLNQGGNQ